MDAGLFAEEAPPALSHYIEVQPIQVYDDAGKDPAVMHNPTHRVRQAYTGAGVELTFLPVIPYHDKGARDGGKNLDTIQGELVKAGLVDLKAPRIHLVFVDAIDGRKGPQGRGRMHGNLTFIAQTQKMPEAMAAFVIAHEMGHNLGLKHAVDDPAVPNDISNLLGDGPFEERVGIKGLHPSQKKTVLASPLTRPLKPRAVTATPAPNT